MAAKGEYNGSNKKLVKFASKWYPTKSIPHNLWHLVDEMWPCPSQFIAFNRWKCDHGHPNLQHSVDEMWACPS